MVGPPNNNHCFFVSTEIKHQPYSHRIFGPLGVEADELAGQIPGDGEKGLRGQFCLSSKRLFMGENRWENAWEFPWDHENP